MRYLPLAIWNVPTIKSFTTRVPEAVWWSRRFWFMTPVNVAPLRKRTPLLILLFVLFDLGPSYRPGAVCGSLFVSLQHCELWNAWVVKGEWMRRHRTYVPIHIATTRRVSSSSLLPEPYVRLICRSPTASFALLSPAVNFAAQMQGATNLACFVPAVPSEPQWTHRPAWKTLEKMTRHKNRQGLHAFR